MVSYREPIGPVSQVVNIMAIQQILILSLIQEIVVAGSGSADDTPECWKYGFNEDANPTLGNNCAHPYDEQASVQAQIRRDTVSFTAEFVFSFDKFTLRNEAVDTLNVLAMRSEDNRLQIRVVGHADFKGSDAYNQTLSERRAQTVANYLVSKGVPVSKISVVGMGKSEARMTEIRQRVVAKLGKKCQLPRNVLL